MRIGKKVLVVALSCTLAMLQFVNVSATEIVKEGTFTSKSDLESGVEVVSEYSTDSELLKKAVQEGMVQTSKTSTVTYEDDLVITETDITYQQLFPTSLTSMVSVQAKSSGYKSKFCFHTFTVSSSKGKKLLRLDQITDFRYNGIYAYVADKESIYYPYNGASFVNRKSGYTTSSSKSRTLAKYWMSGDIKWSTKKNSYTKHRVFTSQCTPKGSISYTLTKS